MNNFENLVNPQASKICQILADHGYQAYLVGDCVRDMFLGRFPEDWEIVTDATPAKIQKIFPKTYATNLKNGIITVALGNDKFEVNTFKIDGRYKNGQRPEEVFFVMNIEQDLSRRDITINAIAYDPLLNKVVDPYQGIQDIFNKTIRCVENPRIRFQEDGFRVLKAIRFAAQFDYAIEKNTFKAMQNNLEALKKADRERLTDELCELLIGNNPSYGLNLINDIGALGIVSPLLASKDLPLLNDQNKVKGKLETNLAFLYKRNTIPTVKEELIKLKLSNYEIKKVIFLLELMERFVVFVNKNTASAYKSFIAVIKNHSVEPWIDTLNQFIILSEAHGYNSNALLNNFKDEIVFSRQEMQINGFDLIESGFYESNFIKHILDECYLEILRFPEKNNKNTLIEYAKSLDISTFDIF